MQEFKKYCHGLGEWSLIVTTNDGFSLPHAIHRLNLTGKDLTDNLMKILTERETLSDRSRKRLSDVEEFNENSDVFQF